MRKGGGRGRTIPALIAAFYAGGIAGWLLHAAFTPAVAVPPDVEVASKPVAAPTVGSDVPESSARTAPMPTASRDAVEELRARGLRLPVDGASIEDMKGRFAEPRGGGSRGHEAVDVLAPRHTPVRAVEAGTIAKLFTSEAGGVTVYQFDPTGRFCYYYAHLHGYAPGLREGQHVAAGDVIGFVGTTGNAPPDTPHLHFAVFELTPEKRWSDGTPIDPYLVFRTD